MADLASITSGYPLPLNFLIRHTYPTLLNHSSGVNGPDLLDDSFAMGVEEIVQIDRGVNVAGNHLDTITNFQGRHIRARSPSEGAMLVSQISVCISRVLALSQAAVGRQRLQSGVYGDLVRALFADDGRE